MKFRTKINNAIKLGFQGFNQFIEEKLKKDPLFLERPFWVEDGSQMTVLNYLIQQYPDNALDDESSVGTVDGVSSGDGTPSPSWQPTKINAKILRITKNFIVFTGCNLPLVCI